MGRAKVSIPFQMDPSIRELCRSYMERNTPFSLFVWIL